MLRELQKREWPGNVRELENVLLRALINLGPEEENLTREDVLAAMGEKILSKKEALQEKFDHFPLQINEAIKITEQYCIKRALKKYGGDKNRAAVDLGIPIRTLYYKCKKLEI